MLLEKRSLWQQTLLSAEAGSVPFTQLPPTPTFCSLWNTCHSEGLSLAVGVFISWPHTECLLDIWISLFTPGHILPHFPLCCLSSLSSSSHSPGVLQQGLYPPTFWKCCSHLKFVSVLSSTQQNFIFLPSEISCSVSVPFSSPTPSHPTCSSGIPGIGNLPLRC